VDRNRLVTIAALIAMILAPIGFLVWLRVETRDQLSELEASPMPLTAEAKLVSLDESTVAIALPTRTEGRTLSLAGTGGTVTSILLSPGVSLGDSEPVLEIDRVSRLGYVAEAPFHRSLTVGDRGQDVTALGGLLVKWGLLADFDGEVFDTRIRTGVEALAERIGVSSDGRFFDRSWLVWLGPESFVVGETSIRVGDALNGFEAIAREVGEVTEVTFASPTGSALNLSGQRVFVGPDFTARVTNGLVTEDDLDLFANTPSEGIEGLIRLAIPRYGARVASTAVQVGPTGSTCVWVQEGTEYSPVPVVVQAGRASLSEIEGLEDGAIVLINPTAVLDDASCP